MRMTYIFRFLVSLIIFSAPILVSAAGGKGQGAVALKDNTGIHEAPSSESAVLHKLKKGEAVAGNNGSILVPSFLFEEVDGWLNIWFLPSVPSNQKVGWVKKTDVSRFTYDGSCSEIGGKFSPFVEAAGLFTGVRWNACFEEALDLKTEALQKSESKSKSDK